MSIEEIERQWEPRVRWYNREQEILSPLAHFAIEYMPKLLAVAKAAESCSYMMDHNTNSLTGAHIDGCSYCKYLEAIKELEKG